MTMDVTVERARCCSLVLQVILGWPLVAKGAPWLSLQPTPSVMKHLGTSGATGSSGTVAVPCCCTASRDLPSRVIRSCFGVSFRIGD
jgi:hypothetical protein